MLAGHFDVTPACRGHFAVAPSLTLGTSRSAVDDMVRSPKPMFAALAVAARAAENTLKLSPIIVHGTHSSPGDAPTHTVTHSPPGARTHHPRAHL